MRCRAKSTFYFQTKLSAAASRDVRWRIEYCRRARNSLNKTVQSKTELSMLFIFSPRHIYTRKN
ncbi:hypothetical protein IscW_ISCW015212 [Ixodes scapularis]|uniref:Uncharacterized protein n=1 Tax=Ixodes scapularis TaxID=6945 RepID=B7QNZ4_IXOSC|nr:hypothetical protein IscW_ISCW015212 [Ixodes scapularis]|eukprot:XP_002416649.1 hypothetical protein IscW_ISCW015212 [Ixodes scapularis]